MATTGRHDARGRSTGKPLARDKHFKISGQFAPRLIEMLRAPAWRVLSLSGRRFLDRLEIELAAHGGNDNGRLPLTYADLVEYGLDRHAIAPAIRETVALGFVEVTEVGRADNGEFRFPSRYRLTYRPTKHAPPTDEWKRVTTTDDAAEIARQAREAKRKASGGKRHSPVGETHTEMAGLPMGETPTTGSVGKPPHLSISRVGDAGDTPTLTRRDAR